MQKMTKKTGEHLQLFPLINIYVSVACGPMDTVDDAHPLNIQSIFIPCHKKSTVKFEKYHKIL